MLSVPVLKATPKLEIVTSTAEPFQFQAYVQTDEEYSTATGLG